MEIGRNLIPIPWDKIRYLYIDALFLVFLHQLPAPVCVVLLFWSLLLVGLLILKSCKGDNGGPAQESLNPR